MKLHFLGTCGGRYAMGEQLRNTGGIVFETEKTRMHIDPGPGALVQSHEYFDNPLKTDGVIVSHGHLDHQSDAEAVIEMITECGKNPGALFANETALSGYSDIEKSIDDYHQNLCATVRTLEDESDFEFQDLKIESQFMFHSDPKTAGFKISTDERTIGFWTDSEFSSELVEFYEGCDWLVVYCTRPRGKSLPQHTSLSEVPELIAKSGANTAIITHFGYSFLKSDMEKEKEWINEKVDAKVLFADDGMGFPGNRSLGDF